jgi:Tol biopolymer transport system component
VLDVASGAAKQLTSGPENKTAPAWSSDGRQIAYMANLGPGARALYRMAADGSGKEELVYRGPALNLTGWSNDDRYWTFFGTDPNDAKSQNDLWVIPVRGERKLMPFVHTAANELGGRISANARFVGYRSDESGKEEIYVKPFDPAAPSAEKWKVSTNGGTMIRWRRDNQELYYLSGDGQFMAVPVSARGAFKAEAPKPLFRLPEEFTRSAEGTLPGGLTDISDDGTRFLLLMPAAR